MIDPDYDEKIALWETLEDLKEIQKRISLLIEKIKRFIPSESESNVVGGIDDNFGNDNPLKVIKEYGFTYFV